MDAVTLINKYIDGEKLLNHYEFNHVERYGKSIRCACKLHGGNNPTAFIFNQENNMWFCHTGDCGGGDAYQLIMDLEGISYPQAIMRMAELFNVDISDLELTTIKNANQKEQDEWLKLISRKRKEFKPYTNIWEGKSISKIRNYSKETIDFFGAEYVEKFNGVNRDGELWELNKRILIPIYMNNMLIGVTLRKVKSEDFPKWSHQGFDSRNVLYNYDNCKSYLEENPHIDEVILVEGAYDVWSYWEQGIRNVVATFGAHISNEQEELLYSLASDLVLSYDGDKAGKSCVQKAIKELKNKFGLYVIDFEEDLDPGSVENLKERYTNKIYYTKWRR